MRSIRNTAFAMLTALSTLLLSDIAQAQSSGRTTASVNLRTGPGVNYAVIVSIPYGASIVVYSCRPAWCDTTWRNYRGWVARRYVAYGGGYAPPPPPPPRY